MNAHAVKVSAFGYYGAAGQEWHQEGPSNETALFQMSNGAVVRICEYRDIGHQSRETFRIYGDSGSFENGRWCDKSSSREVGVDEMRDPLPEEVARAFQAELRAASADSQERTDDFLGGHGGSHAYLVHEFVTAVSQDRRPAVNVFEAVRYMIMGVMAHKSVLRNGETMTVPDFGDPPD
jgi:predicted dehydrogenase